MNKLENRKGDDQNADSSEIEITSGPDYSDPLGGNRGTGHSLPKEFSASHLPTCRLASLFYALITSEVALSILLYFAGSFDYRLDDAIRNYAFASSVVDLVIFSVIRLVVLCTLCSRLESFIFINYLCKRKVLNLCRPKKVYVLFVICSLSFVVCAIVKAVWYIPTWIIYKNNSAASTALNQTTMSKNVTMGVMSMGSIFSLLASSGYNFPATDLIVVVLSVAATLLELIFSILSIHFFFKQKKRFLLSKDKVPNKGSILRLVRLVKPEAGWIILATVFLLFSTVANVISPFYFGKVIDAAQKSMYELNWMAVTLLLIFCGASISSALRVIIFEYASQKFVARLRRHLFSCIIRQEIGFFDTTRTGELINRLSSDTHVLQNAVTTNISMMSRYVLLVLGSLIFMVILDASLTAILLTVVPIISVAAIKYGSLLKKLRCKFQQFLADANSTAEENLSSIRTVRSFVGEAKAKLMYSQDVEKSFEVGKKMALLNGAFTASIGFGSYLGIVLAMWYGGKLVNQGHISPGLLTAFLIYTLQVAMALAFISSLYGELMQAVGASVRIFELIDRNPRIGSGKARLSSPISSVEFKNIGFCYPSREENVVLKDVTFEIKSGQLIALVGPSGGGKSTIIHLLLRLYEANSGEILINGCNLLSLDAEWFRTRVSVVSQEPTLFGCSIRDNIAYGRVANDEEVFAAAKLANAHDFILAFDKGYDTLVGERGIRLSGGQKQRVAIARALLVKPDILLLDEATSALDSESEHHVQEAIDRVLDDLTVLVIAHRLSTVRNADKVIVIENGTVCEQGTHDELVSMDSVYRKLVMNQLNG